jgi:hypothetical protein
MRVTLVIAVAVAALAAAAPGSGAPSDDVVLRPGIGIGELRVGMTFVQARAVFRGAPIVQKRRRYGFQSEYVEYAWGVSDWVVAVVGRGARARVVAVATGLRSERTPRFKVGVGSTERDVRQRLGARCFGKEEQFDPITKQRVYVPTVGKDAMACYLGRDPRGPHTVFSLEEDCRIDPLPAHVHCPAGERVYRVYEVRVGEPRFARGYWG